jgi:glycosyltransferase involved in cell wall biosynthesis
MIRILYLADTIETPRAGTERQLLGTLERLDRHRFAPVLVTLRSSPWLETAALPCERVALGLRSLARPEAWSARARFLRLCREGSIDLVHAWFREANLAGPLWTSPVKGPVVVGSRRNIGYRGRPVDRVLGRAAARRTRHVVANSEAAARRTVEHEGFRPDQVTVIANGLDLVPFATSSNGDGAAARERWGFPPDAVVVGCLANLRPIKNLPFLLESAAALASRVPAARFVILGEGPQRKDLEARVRALGLEGRCILPGSSTDVPRDLAGIDVGVLVSTSESSPNAVIEYLAAGKPVVAADVGGTRELLDGEEAGAVYPSGDRDRFLDLITPLLADGDRRKGMGARARALAASRHDWAAVLPRLESLYIALCGTGKREP